MNYSIRGVIFKKGISREAVKFIIAVINEGGYLRRRVEQFYVILQYIRYMCGR